MNEWVNARMNEGERKLMKEKRKQDHRAYVTKVQ